MFFKWRDREVLAIGPPLGLRVMHQFVARRRQGNRCGIDSVGESPKTRGELLDGMLANGFDRTSGPVFADPLGRSNVPSRSAIYPPRRLQHQRTRQACAKVSTHAPKSEVVMHRTQRAHCPFQYLERDCQLGSGAFYRFGRASKASVRKVLKVVYWRFA